MAPNAWNGLWPVSDQDELRDDRGHHQRTDRCSRAEQEPATEVDLRSSGRLPAVVVGQVVHRSWRTPERFRSHRLRVVGADQSAAQNHGQGVGHADEFLQVGRDEQHGETGGPGPP